MSALDVNAVIAGLLQDMAAIQTSKQRQRGYGQAASAVRGLDVPIDEMRGADGALRKIPHVGPSSTRIIEEVLATGASPTVEQAVETNGQRKDIDKRRGWRENFLSRAMALRVLRELGEPLVSNYRADFQMHSTWSDGRQTLDEIVVECRRRGYTHCAVTDHSAGLPIAKGLSTERLVAQAEDIARVNRDHEGAFRLLHGVEANITSDGGLDVEPAALRLLDIVVAAPHSGLRSSESQTARMLATVATPGIHILGHPRGRKYGARPGVIARWREVFAEAAEREVAIEIDGDPSRQDVDFDLAHQALDAGCLIAVDSDAHSPSELAYSEIALAHAVIAGIPADRMLNCWPLDRLLAWAHAKRG